MNNSPSQDWRDGIETMKNFLEGQYDEEKALSILTAIKVGFKQGGINVSTQQSITSYLHAQFQAANEAAKTKKGPDLKKRPDLVTNYASILCDMSSALSLLANQADEVQIYALAYSVLFCARGCLDKEDIIPLRPETKTDLDALLSTPKAAA